ncbi:response regulator transcription factor [Actinosynnema sp. CS-041913]|uniref:response regulator transcription factor n=1 Tax=Actinosynnema sp. CS-041913 TaxID=3239917 RepID=UPI003D89B57C
MNETGRVLVVDDDVTVRDVVRRYLELAGHEVELVGDGEHALRRIAEREPDLVVLDLMLPGIDGLEVCRRLRARSAVPVVMLTALGEEEDRIAGLQLGADDYVTKPFSPRELALRVTSVLRRARVPVDRAGAVLVDGNLRVDVGARAVWLDGRELPLTTREFDLLVFFLAHRGRAFSRAELLSRVWGWEFGDQSTVTVHVRRLREKVEVDSARPVRIVTVWGVGYRYDGGS